MGNEFYLSDGKNFAATNPIKPSEFLRVDSKEIATRFSYRQAKSLTQKSKKGNAWLRNCQIVPATVEAKKDRISPNYKGRGDMFTGSRDVEIKEEVLTEIMEEVQNVLNLTAWDADVITKKRNYLLDIQSKCDSGLSDVDHALQKYSRDHNGKRPAAHKVAKICYMVIEIRCLRERIKECLRYLDAFQAANQNKYSLSALQYALEDVKHQEYKGRTDYYKQVIDILQ